MLRQLFLKYTPSALALFLLVAAAVALAAWQGPGAVPPGGNTETPINTGTTTQDKAGAFRAGGLRSFTDLIVDGKVGIGTTTPGEALTVVGTIESTSGGVKFPDGTVQTTRVSIYPTLSPGPQLWHANDGYVNVGEVVNPTLAKRSEIAASGMLRISYRSDVADMHSFTVSCYSFIARNGTQVGPTHDNLRYYYYYGSGRYATFSDDIEGWNPGDMVEVYTWSDDNPSYSADAKCAVDNFRIYVDALPPQTRAIQ